jgi:uncharacterized surface protein with fasciclin (FAS1) repeats
MAGSEGATGKEKEMKSTGFAGILEVLLSPTPVGGGTTDRDLVETVVAAGRFHILAKALKAAELTESLNGAGPFTLFAPSDYAFKRLPQGALESLFKPEHKEQLRAILAHHVVVGRFTAAEAVNRSLARTLNGQNLRIRNDDEVVVVNNARVIHADIEARNGVIHVVDRVILPENN